MQVLGLKLKRSALSLVPAHRLGAVTAIAGAGYALRVILAVFADPAVAMDADCGPELGDVRAQAAGAILGRLAGGRQGEQSTARSLDASAGRALAGQSARSAVRLRFAAYFLGAAEASEVVPATEFPGDGGLGIHARDVGVTGFAGVRDRSAARGPIFTDSADPRRTGVDAEDSIGDPTRSAVGHGAADDAPEGEHRFMGPSEGFEGFGAVAAVAGQPLDKGVRSASIVGDQSVPKGSLGVRPHDSIRGGASGQDVQCAAKGFAGACARLCPLAPRAGQGGTECF